jgi:hypothetical protein
MGGIPRLAEELLASQQGLCTLQSIRILYLHSDLHETSEVGDAIK